MLDLQRDVVLWLIGWSFVGSILGFFTIRHNSEWTAIEMSKELFKSITVGIFFALPTYMLLEESKSFSVSTNIVLAGSVAFVITDGIIHLWPKFIHGIGELFLKIVEKVIDRTIGK